MADATELEKDVKLQRDSADLIADLKSSLKPFLWKTTTSGEAKIRRRVKLRDLERLVQLLDQFQELPQLLDPHLDNFVPLLADSFLAYLRSPPPKHASPHPEQLVPLYKAICKLLYSFCKVRGDKVIVRFFSTETRHLELLLSAIEVGTSHLNLDSLGVKAEQDMAHEASWHWEETYITLLWLSQLLLAPFDLASISSGSSQDAQRSILGLKLPNDIPGIAFRVLALAHRFLSSAGKERDAAKVLLVRVAMRRDMQDLGVMNAVTSWALSSFSSHRACPETFESLGILSFIAGLLASSVGTTNMNSYLPAIYNVAQEVSNLENKHYKSIFTSPAARKIIIKILRTISVILLQRRSSMSSSEMIETVIGHMLESLQDQATPVRLAASKALSIIALKLPPDMASQVVEEVLAGFEKNVVLKVKSGDIKSSRDLSRVNRFEWHGLTLTLSHLIFRRSIPPENISPILRALRLALSFEQQSTSGSAVGANVRDAACFGMWALARRYSTKELDSLKIESDIFNLFPDGSEGPALQILATELVVAACLDPEGNIRRGCSAALQELIGRHPDMIAEGIKVVQVVDYHAVALRSRAVEEAGIGAAKLSEYYYMGILKGLLSWRGICDPNAAARRVAAWAIGKLSAISKRAWARQPGSTDSWQDIPDIVSLIVPRISLLVPWDIDQRHGLILSFAAVIEQFSGELTRTNIDHQLASIPVCSPKDRLSLAMKAGSSTNPESDEPLENRYPLLKMTDAECPFYALILALLRNIITTLSATQTIFEQVRQPKLIADAVSHLIVASWWVLRADCIFREFDTRRVRRMYAIATSPDQDQDAAIKLQMAMTHERQKTSLMDLLEQGPYSSWPNEIQDTMTDNTILPNVSITEISRNMIDEFLRLGDADTVDIVSKAAVDLVSLLGPQETNAWIAEWKIQGLAVRVPARKEKGRAYLHALFKLPIYAEGFMPGTMRGRMSDEFRETVIEGIHTRWNASTALTDVVLKVVILRCLTSSLILRQRPSAFASILESALDDYTTNARGDVGSLLRVEAAKAVAVIWDSEYLRDALPGSPERDISVVLFPRIMRIASEKLDRVRVEGRKALFKLDLRKVTAEPTLIPEMPDGNKLLGSFYDPSLSDSSKEYFRHLLDVRTEFSWEGQECSEQSWGPEFMAGYVTSADTGSEDLVRASRAALVDFCATSSQHAICIAETLNVTLSRNLKNDRVLIPTLEVIAFLLDMNFIRAEIDKCELLRRIYSSVEKASVMTRNVRKIEAVIKCLGAMAEICKDGNQEVFTTSPLKKLGRFLLHKFPRVRDCAADEIFMRTGKGKGVNWEKAGEDELDKLDLGLGLVC